ncbi:PrgI family protein, partial [Bacillus sp. SRB_28]
LYLEYKYLNPQKRYFKVSKRNVKVAAERNMMNEKRKVRKTKSVSSVAKTN